jgi:hypothetical protein
MVQTLCYLLQEQQLRQHPFPSEAPDPEAAPDQEIPVRSFPFIRRLRRLQYIAIRRGRTGFTGKSDLKIF